MRVLFGCAFMDEYSQESLEQMTDPIKVVVDKTGEKAPGFIRRNAGKLIPKSKGGKIAAGVGLGVAAVGGTAAVLARRKKKREAAEAAG